MTIPFVDLFQKIRARFLARTQHDRATGVGLGGAQKPSSHGLSKTVLPNARQSSARPDPFLVAAGAPPVTAPSLTMGPRKIVSAAGPVAPKPRDLPPALAMALEPRMERAISLPLGDFIEHIPADYIRPIEVIDANRSVALKASEIEKGMPERNPTISLPSLYQQVPEIFLRTVAPTDPTRVPLPYGKVLEQFNNARVRGDQVREVRIPQLETPILRATIEDTERFGTQVEPLESSSLPPVPVEPATAKTIASAEPEAIARETGRSTSSKSAPPRPPISLRAANAETFSKKISPTSPTDFDAPPTPPAKIPFQLPPNGTGGPVSERVPASSGPPVPTISAPPAKPLRIPFHPSDESVDPKTSEEPEKPILRQADAPTLHPAGVAPDLGETLEQVETGAATISLALKPLLQNVPAFQLNSDPSTLAEDIRVRFPLALVEPQLASGRVVIPAKTFQEALPEPHRALFIIDPAETAVALPLAEVLKNLPDGVLKMRADQENNFAEADFETPFSAKAKEDAERFQPAITRTSVEPVDQTPGGLNLHVKPKIDIASASSPVGRIRPMADRTDSSRGVPEEKITGKQVVALVCQLPGVTACKIMFLDGLSLAGNFPSEAEADGLCAMAPALLQRIDAHMLESSLGPLEAMTLRSAHSAITFFMKGNICLAALHSDAAALAPETQARVNELAEKLSRTFAQPGTPHVDH
jgi:predicted regulator of Ras-like GTPase activity (Roadblock/LC7/MglB family)